MPETKIYLGYSDKLMLVNYVFKQGAKLIIDKHYSTPGYTFIDNIEEFASYFFESSMFFIVHDDFFRTPLEVRMQQEKKFFYIMQRYGGPYIDFYAPGNFNKKVIGQGFIGHYKSYYNIDGKNEQVVSPELKAFYKKIKSYIRKIRHTDIKLKNTNIILGKGAFEEVQNGAILIGCSPNKIKEFQK